MSAAASTDEKRCEVTPAFLRTMMPQGPSAEDCLYYKKRSEVYRVMEVAARQNLYEASFTVVDADIEDERLLDAVYDRLLRWLTRPKDDRNAFSVRPSSKALRSFIVSWDPLETPRSVTEAEANDSTGATYSRLQRHSVSPVKQDKSNHASNYAQSLLLVSADKHLAPPTRSRILYDTMSLDGEVGSDAHTWSPWQISAPFGNFGFAWSNTGNSASLSNGHETEFALNKENTNESD